MQSSAGTHPTARSTWQSFASTVLLIGGEGVERKPKSTCISPSHQQTPRPEQLGRPQSASVKVRRGQKSLCHRRMLAPGCTVSTTIPAKHLKCRQSLVLSRKSPSQRYLYPSQGKMIPPRCPHAKVERRALHTLVNWLHAWAVVLQD